MKLIASSNEGVQRRARKEEEEEEGRPIEAKAGATIK